MKKKVMILLFILAIYSCVLSPYCFSFYRDKTAEVVTLLPYEGGVVYVGVDKHSLNHAIGNIMGKDRAGYLCTFLPNKVYEVERNTKALVLEVNFVEQCAKVKILEGTFSGSIGWVLLGQIADS